MASPYATAALIRSLDQAFVSTTDYDGDVIEAWSTNFADPYIDATLASAGFTAPLATTPNLIKVIAAMFCVSHGLTSYMEQHTGTEIESAAAIWAKAQAMLDQVASGKLDVGLTRAASGQPIVIDTDPDTLESTSTYMGDEEGWAKPTEDRES